MSGAALSGCIGGLRWLGVCALLEGGDDLVEVAGDLPVHLGEPVLAAGLGGGDDLQDLPVVLAVLGQEFGGGDEHRAGQAGVGVGALLDQGQAAIAVRQRLSGPAGSLSGPGGVGQLPAGVQGDGLAVDVDLAGGFPVTADGAVVYPGVMRGLGHWLQDVCWKWSPAGS
jgi:hypothetical protein